MDYAACILKAYPGITLADFSLEQDEDGLRLNWLNATTYGAKPTFEGLATANLLVLRTEALVAVKEIRQLGLDKAALSPGILAIYNTNYEAAVEFIAGRTTAIIKNGMTAEAYLTGFGARLQMTASQFATYIVNENLRIGPTVYDVEKRYLALTYGGDASNGIYPVSMLTTEIAITQAVNNFKSYCEV